MRRPARLNPGGVDLGAAGQIEYNDTSKTIVATGGYLDAIGTPSPSLLDETKFVDASIGLFMDEVQKQGLSDSTLIVITAKHGQSPIDPNRLLPIPGPGAVPNGQSPSVHQAGDLS